MFKQSPFFLSSHIFLQDLVHPKRKFVKEAEIVLVHGTEDDAEPEDDDIIEGHCFLLSDYLLFCTENEDELRKKKQPYVFSDFFPIAFVESIEEDTEYENAIMLSFEEGCVTLVFGDEEEYMGWKKATEECVQNIGNVDILLYIQ